MNFMLKSLFLLCLALLVAACSETEPTAARAPTVLIGVDGGEWQVLDEMIAAGELPTFARIKEQGAWGHLINPGPQVSPVVWTTFATGRFSRDHGILEHVYPYTEGGAKRPVSSELRQVPALWNVASHYGLRSAVVGYFVSHPPEQINGVVVTPKVSQWIDGTISPPGAIDIEQEQFQELKRSEVLAELWAPYFGWDFQRDQATDPDSPFHEAASIVTERNLDRRIVTDELLHRIGLQLAAEPFDLYFGYYRLTDFMSHSLWLFYDSSDWDEPPSEEEQALFGEAVRESYRFTDRAIGQLLEEWDGKANVIIVSDHGFGSQVHQTSREVKRFSHLTGNHRPNGIILATGPDIEPGQVHGITIMEIAPTLAALAGLPVSDELPGEVAYELVREGYFNEYPLKTAASYSDVSVVVQDVETDAASEQADMSSLQGLGYIGEGVALIDSDQVSDYDFWASSDYIMTLNLHMEVMYHLLQGDVKAADAVVDLLKANRPDLFQRLLRGVRAKFARLTERLPTGDIDPAPFRQFLKAHQPPPPQDGTADS